MVVQTPAQYVVAANELSSLAGVPCVKVEYGCTSVKVQNDLLMHLVWKGARCMAFPG